MGLFSKNRASWGQKLSSRLRRKPQWETAEEFLPEEDMFSEFDPFGSYTGFSMDGELPEQDADDM